MDYNLAKSIINPLFICLFILGRLCGSYEKVMTWIMLFNVVLKYLPNCVKNKMLTRSHYKIVQEIYFNISYRLLTKILTDQCVFPR